MADNAVALQIGQGAAAQQQAQPASLLQTALNLQKLQRAFPANASMAQPVRSTAFNPDTGND